MISFLVGNRAVFRLFLRISSKHLLNLLFLWLHSCLLEKSVTQLTVKIEKKVPREQTAMIRLSGCKLKKEPLVPGLWNRYQIVSICSTEEGPVPRRLFIRSNNWFRKTTLDHPCPMHGPRTVHMKNKAGQQTQFPLPSSILWPFTRTPPIDPGPRNQYSVFFLFIVKYNVLGFILLLCLLPVTRKPWWESYCNIQGCLLASAVNIWTPKSKLEKWGRFFWISHCFPCWNSYVCWVQVSVLLPWHYDFVERGLSSISDW